MEFLGRHLGRCVSRAARGLGLRGRGHRATPATRAALSEERAPEMTPSTRSTNSADE